MGLPSYSVLMSVYAKETPGNLRAAIDSVLGQTAWPDEFLIVADGPLTEGLDAVLEDYISKYPDLFTLVRLPNNSGLHVALRAGLDAVRNEFIMRMDSDDIATAVRAEEQLIAFQNDPGLGCVGSNVAEFVGAPENVVAHVSLPLSHEEMTRFAVRRNPMRHPSMMYRLSAVREAGGYRDVPYFEDWDLVLRLIDSGAHLRNLPDELVLMRVSSDFYQRRGGFSYLRHTFRFLSLCLGEGRMTRVQYARAAVERTIQCLMPNSLRDWVYRFLLRTDANC